MSLEVQVQSLAAAFLYGLAVSFGYGWINRLVYRCPAWAVRLFDRDRPGQPDFGWSVFQPSGNQRRLYECVYADDLLLGSHGL